MRVFNNTPRGASVYITDLKLQLGQDGEVTLSAREAARSTDLITAIEGNLVRLEFTGVERNLSSLQGLLKRINQAEAKRTGALLATRIETVMDSIDTASLEVPVRPVVFAPIDE